MTQPQEGSFQPDATHAVAAQQEEIVELRAVNAQVRDRNVYLSACMKQIQVEARTEIARLNAEISMLRTELMAVSGAKDTPVEENQPPEG